MYQETDASLRSWILELRTTVILVFRSTIEADLSLIVTGGATLTVLQQKPSLIWTWKLMLIHFQQKPSRF